MQAVYSMPAKIANSVWELTCKKIGYKRVFYVFGSYKHALAERARAIECDKAFSELLVCNPIEESVECV